MLLETVMLKIHVAATDSRAPGSSHLYPRVKVHDDATFLKLEI